MTTIHQNTRYIIHYAGDETTIEKVHEHFDDNGNVLSPATVHQPGDPDWTTFLAGMVSSRELKTIHTEIFAISNLAADSLPNIPAAAIQAQVSVMGGDLDNAHQPQAQYLCDGGSDPTGLAGGGIDLWIRSVWEARTRQDIQDFRILRTGAATLYASVEYFGEQ